MLLLLDGSHLGRQLFRGSPTTPGRRLTQFIFRNYVTLSANNRINTCIYVQLFAMLSEQLRITVRNVMRFSTIVQSSVTVAKRYCNCQFLKLDSKMPSMHWLVCV